MDQWIACLAPIMILSPPCLTFSAPCQSRPLAAWKTWWDPELPKAIAESLNSHIDPLQLPGKGCLLANSHFNGNSLKDPHTANVSEAMLLKYPENRQPSGYLLGDSVMHLDVLWNGSLLGGVQNSPLKENKRRENALGEGGKLKKLLSYVRSSALKSENGKTPEITYLKGLANQRRREKTTSPASPSASSPRSFYSGTTMILGYLDSHSGSLIYLLIFLVFKYNKVGGNNIIQ